MDVEIQDRETKIENIVNTITSRISEINAKYDGQNTLQYFYGNISESTDKYVEIMRLAFEIMQRPADFRLDKKWNANVPKMIDNAIFLLQPAARGK